MDLSASLYCVNEEEESEMKGFSSNIHKIRKQGVPLEA
jgi:hypothetical protein